MIEQPFLRQAAVRPCPTPCRQGTQIVPVAGNNTRPVPRFVVYHGRDHLNLEGLITSTPVHMTYADAARVADAHN
jgi:hypothetical protein